MEELPGHEDEQEEDAYSKRLAALNGLNGTNKHRAVPQRPSNMTRVEQVPLSPRVSRPRRTQPKGLGRGLLIIIGILLLCTIGACVFGYSLGANLFTGLNVSSGAASVSNNFLASLVKQDYVSAYTDLGGAITMQLTLEQFQDKAQHDDSCFGPVRGYTEVPNSANTQGNTQNYTYTVTRNKIVAPYPLHLTLQQDIESSNVWKITNYGGDLGPSEACDQP